jgi:hypothetical protein
VAYAGADASRNATFKVNAARSNVQQSEIDFKMFASGLGDVPA